MNLKEITDLISLGIFFQSLGALTAKVLSPAWILKQIKDLPEDLKGRTGTYATGSWEGRHEGPSE